MILDEFYTSIYFITISICLLFVLAPLFKYGNLYQIPRSILNVNSVLLLLIVIGFIGFRNPWGDREFFGDTRAYTRMFELLSAGDDRESIRDPGFYYFMKFCSSIISIQWFYVLCAILYTLPPYLAFKRWFGKNALFGLSIFVVSMSFWSFGINGLRNGIATSLFLYAISLKRYSVMQIFFMGIAILFHASVILPIIAYVICHIYKNTKVLIALWLIMIPISYFLGSQIDVIMQKIALLGDSGVDRTQNLFANELDGRSMVRGYRLDFILYSGIPILFGYIYIYKKRVKDVIYNQLFNVYLMSNIAWLFFIYAAFTNRIAYLSWFLMPVVMLYPLLKYRIIKKQNILIGCLIIGTLTFTLLQYIK